MRRRRAPRRSTSERRRAARRDILATLALAGAMFVSILALPIGKVHESACLAISHVAGRPVPCGLSELSISLGTDKPFVSISLTPIKLPLKL
ncbi:hypothetical protein DMC47_43140 [Nostoc sp. 3335mG]|nr:hypothetical protein DMC47_43140 [Nostoc sp. 3335mG]